MSGFAEQSFCHPTNKRIGVTHKNITLWLESPRRTTTLDWHSLPCHRGWLPLVPVSCPRQRQPLESQCAADDCGRDWQSSPRLGHCHFRMMMMMSLSLPFVSKRHRKILVPKLLDPANLSILLLLWIGLSWFVEAPRTTKELPSSAAAVSSQP